MKMDDQEESGNVEDVRGAGGGFQFRPVHGVGLGTVVLALVGGWIFGINPLQILGLLSGGTGVQTAPAPAASPSSGEDPQVRFVRQVLGSTETVWADVFSHAGR